MDSRPLRLLSLGEQPRNVGTFGAEALAFFNDAGVKRLIFLLLLKEISHVLKKQGHSIQPYEYFDLIGGTSTGGYAPAN